MIRINKKECIHYFLIYFMIILNQSCFYEYFIDGGGVRFLILCITAILMLLNFKNDYGYYFLVAIMFLFFVVITRIISGGIGLFAWIIWILPLLFTVYTINYDKEYFFDRFLKISFILAIVGIVFFLIQVLNPEYLKKILFFKYDTKFINKIWTEDYSNFSLVNQKGFGLFLFSYRPYGDSLLRNKSIFTESGIAQMIFNISIIICLFFSDKLHISQKLLKKYLLAFILSVITIQSTTGYIVLLIILLGYLINKNKFNKKHNFKIFIVAILFFICSFLLIDFFMRDSDSFISVAILEKFINGNTVELSGSGMSRIDSIMISIEAMLKNPVGIGSDKLWAQISDLAGGGGGLLVFGATVGIVPLLTCIYIYIHPIFKNQEITFVTKMLIVIITMYILLAQTTPFYSIMLILPIYFSKNKVYKIVKR